MKLPTLACSCNCVSHLITFSTALPVSWAHLKYLCCLYSLANIDSFLFERVITKCYFGDIMTISVLLTFLTFSHIQMLCVLQEGCIYQTVIGLSWSFPSLLSLPVISYKGRWLGVVYFGVHTLCLCDIQVAKSLVVLSSVKILEVCILSFCK